MKEKLNTQPYKGSRDFYPEDMRLRNFIFDTWRKVCEGYGYEEYDGPFLENFEIYAAKSGEELVNEQLYSFQDRGERKIAIRPEMTPTLARMIAQKISELPRPIRWYSIPNLWRYEKPQKGRAREFYQLNVDLFGVEGVEADFEVICTVIDILKSFGAKEGMFEVRINNKRLVDDLYLSLSLGDKQRKIVNKALDKRGKMDSKEFNSWLREDANLTDDQIAQLNNFLNNPQEILESKFSNSKGATELISLLELIKQQGLEKFVRFSPEIIRGLDYYTGNVFEVYDLNPQNTRAMAGGGRYDDLVSMFSDEKLTGTGYAMGDITLKNFLEDWNLLPKLSANCDYLVTVWPSENNDFLKRSLEVSNLIRKKGKSVQTWLEVDTKLDKQLKYADKKQVSSVIIVGQDELKSGEITIKTLASGSQETMPLDKFLENIK